MSTVLKKHIDVKTDTPLGRGALFFGVERNIFYAFFGRKGGVSQGFYNSLNVGRGSADNPRNVKENRDCIAAAMGVDPSCLVTPFQVHGNHVFTVGTDYDFTEIPEADALVTKMTGIALGIVTADCAPLLFFDPDAGVIGAVHAGWRGARAGIARSAVNQMEHLGAQRSKIKVIIGPSILQEHYQIGQDFYDLFLHEKAENARHFRLGKDSRCYFDLSGYIHEQLKEMGLSGISRHAICTYSQEDILFSYRRSQERKEPDYGRQMSAIVLLDSV